MTIQTTTGMLPAQPQQFGTVIQSEATALRGLDDWLRAAGSAEQLARQLVHSFFVPQAYKPGNPRDEAAVGIAVANATGAILLGQSLGLDPLTALQQIYVVHGRPGMYAKLKVALAQAAGHRVWDEEYTAESATVCGQRHGTDDVVRITITMEQAKQAGWTSNAAYQKTPADMLWARAASRVVDRIAADLLMGIQSIEDIDEDDAPAARVTQVRAEDIARPPVRTGALAALPTRTLEQPPAAAEQELVHVAQAEAPEPIGEAQWKAINNRFVELRDGGLTALGGPGSSAARLRVIVSIIGRDIAKGSELTAAEAAMVLDNLKASPGQRLASDVLEPKGVAVDPVEAAQQHAATVEQQIAAARADADARAAQYDDEQAQAEQVDPTVEGGWPA